MDMNVDKKEVVFSTINLVKIENEPLGEKTEHLSEPSSLVEAMLTNDESETNDSRIKKESARMKNVNLCVSFNGVDRMEDSGLYLESTKENSKLFIPEKILKYDQNIVKSQSHDQSSYLKQPKNKTCEECGREFRSNSDLNKHFRVHTGEKPYDCPVCEKSFARKSQMDQHLLIHTDAKPYECDICMRKFRHKSSVDKHRLIHFDDRPFPCDQCELRLRTQGDLNKHKRIHLDKKPFECDICNKGFVRQVHLDIHKRSHTGEKPHFCDLCDKTFKHNSGLKYHKAHGHRNLTVSPEKL